MGILVKARSGAIVVARGLQEAVNGPALAATVWALTSPAGQTIAQACCIWKRIPLR
jgi:hypothetical protein